MLSRQNISLTYSWRLKKNWGVHLNLGELKVHLVLPILPLVCFNGSCSICSPFSSSQNCLVGQCPPIYFLKKLWICSHIQYFSTFCNTSLFPDNKKTKLDPDQVTELRSHPGWKPLCVPLWSTESLHYRHAWTGNRDICAKNCWWEVTEQSLKVHADMSQTYYFSMLCEKAGTRSPQSGCFSVR